MCLQSFFLFLDFLVAAWIDKSFAALMATVSLHIHSLSKYTI